MSVRHNSMTPVRATAPLPLRPPPPLSHPLTMPTSRGTEGAPPGHLPCRFLIAMGPIRQVSPASAGICRRSSRSGYDVRWDRGETFTPPKKGSGIECAASVRITARAIPVRVCGSVRASVRITAMPESPTVTGYLTPPRRVCGSVRRVCGSLKGMPVDRVCGVCAPPIGGTPLTQAVPRFSSGALRGVDVERGAVTA